MQAFGLSGVRLGNTHNSPTKQIIMKKYIIIISFAAASLSLGSAAAQTYIYGNRIRSNMEKYNDMYEDMQRQKQEDRIRHMQLQQERLESQQRHMEQQLRNSSRAFNY